MTKCPKLGHTTLLTASSALKGASVYAFYQNIFFKSALGAGRGWDGSGGVWYAPPPRDSNDLIFTLNARTNLHLFLPPWNNLVTAPEEGGTLNTRHRRGRCIHIRGEPTDFPGGGHI